MDNKKTDQYYIDKIITDLTFIRTHTESLSKSKLEEDGYVFLNFSVNFSEFSATCISRNIIESTRISSSSNFDFDRKI